MVTLGSNWWRMRSMRSLIVFVLSACMAALELAQPAQTWAQNEPKRAPSVVRVKLPYGIEISLPAGWVLEDAASNKVRSDRSTAILDLANVPTGPGGALLTASPDGDPDRTSVIV